LVVSGGEGEADGLLEGDWLAEGERDSLNEGERETETDGLRL
jgi:hypothetical protein